MALSILDSAFVADPLRNGAITSSPVAGIPYTLDVAWGKASGDAAAAVSTTLSCAGATIDTGYALNNAAHVAGATGRTAVDIGWTPDGVSVYLSDRECARGFWRITFPSIGSYTISLSGVGDISVTVSSAAPAPTVPTLTLIHELPLNRQPAKAFVITFSGTYPSGGLDLSENLLGLYAVLFADINDTDALRFIWSANKLRIYNSSGEVSGSISFTTRGLFIGTAG